MLSLLKAVHVLAVLVWVGGMVFAHFFLRPALVLLEPPQRLRLMHEVLRRFFAIVLVAGCCQRPVDDRRRQPGGQRAAASSGLRTGF